MRRAAASLPATPIGYFARRQWEELGTDELSVQEDAPAQQRVLPASSPASPLRASNRRSAFRALQYARVGVDLMAAADVDDDEDEATTAPSFPPPPSFEEDDEATERLLMLLSLPDAVANVQEIMRAASICYSAQLTEHAAVCGDSSTFELPAAISLALASFFAQPGVRTAIESGADEDQTRGQLLALFESLPPPPRVAPAPTVDPRAAASSAADGGASARLAAIGDDALDGLGDSGDSGDSGDEEDDEPDLLGAGGALPSPIKGSSSLLVSVDDDDDDDAKPPGWMRQPARFAAALPKEPSPLETLDPRELGWALDDDDEEEAAPAAIKPAVATDTALLLSQLLIADTDDGGRVAVESRRVAPEGQRKAELQLEADDEEGGGVPLPPWLER